MRILVATTFHPVPPRDGMQLHLHALLTELNRRHDILLVSPGPTDDAALGPLCARHVAYAASDRASTRDRVATELRTLRSGRSKVVDRVIHSGLGATVLDAMRSFEPDVVHLQSGAAAAIAPIGGVPVVAVPLDADDLNALARQQAAPNRVARWLAARESARFRQFEADAYARCDAVVVVTDRDADALRSINPMLRPTVIANGIDTTRFSPTFSPSHERGATNTIVFHGAMDYEPNVDAAQFLVREILPLVSERTPGVKVVLAGRNPTAAVRALGAANVEVTGELDSVVPVIRDAAVYVCPMRVGSGIKNKLLEAMACGKAIVATPLATSGIGLDAGTHALVAEHPSAFAAAISDLIENPEHRTNLGRAARALAESWSWARCADEFEKVYAAVSAQPSA
jgi:polysaccharide biosynthesis protein PslH